MVRVLELKIAKVITKSDIIIQFLRVILLRAISVDDTKLYSSTLCDINRRYT